MMAYILVMLAGIAVLVLAPISRERAVRTATQGTAGLVFAVGLVFFMARLFGPMA
ncbi:hypothetical protein ACFOD9_02905 [Novosphingobium bradum]|uniref:Uncharacterized protein n=1 Tax=Novosphingobium bradum TaxID=1737444 RepID=A0ABV7IQS6_9SPHN